MFAQKISDKDISVTIFRSYFSDVTENERRSLISETISYEGASFYMVFLDAKVMSHVIGSRFTTLLLLSTLYSQTEHRGQCSSIFLNLTALFKLVAETRCRSFGCKCTLLFFLESSWPGI